MYSGCWKSRLCVEDQGTVGRVKVQYTTYDLSPRLSLASLLEHFHSVSCVGRAPSSDNTGTQPPNTNKLLLMITAECRLQGMGGGPCVVTAIQETFSPPVSARGV